jgi:hypothetical protein
MQGLRPTLHTLSGRAPLPAFHGAAIDPRAICHRPVPEAFVRLVEAVTAYPLLITKLDVPTFKLRIGHKFPTVTRDGTPQARSGARFCLALPPLHRVRGYAPATPRAPGHAPLQRKPCIPFVEEGDSLLFVIQLKSHPPSGAVFVDFEWRRGDQGTFREVYEALMRRLARAGGL